MKIQKILMKLLPVLTLGLLMISCEGGTNREWFVCNQSASEVHIEMQTLGSSTVLKSTIQPGETKRTSVYSSGRGARENEDAPSAIISFLLYNDADTTKKDYTVAGNWSTESEKTKNAPAEYTHKFTFSIEDKDF